MNFTSTEINIETIVSENLEFLIPVYQRPYVWDDIEIIKLLEDLKNNFKNNESEYFVGNTYVIKSSKDNRPNLYEVIDGQQRFTTFWLISLCFETMGINSELKNYLIVKNDIRFDFDIRKEVYEYLKGLLDGSSQKRFDDVSKMEFLKNIAKGVRTIEGFLKQKTEKNNENELVQMDLEGFGKYIYENVKFIFNEAPANTDLNALFVALGTSGIQLQQSDILKARLLGKLKKDAKNDAKIIIQCAKIWEACENMTNYFESNVKASFNFDTSNIESHHFKTFDESIFSISNVVEENRNNQLTISQIVETDINPIAIEKESFRNTQCRSILNFNMFLLHVLRIFNKKNDLKDISSLDSKKLLEIVDIDEIKDEKVKSFFELMWKVRYQFDKHVVKWLKDEDESQDEDEKLLLSEISPNPKDGKTYFSRKEKAFSNLQMLQSVLYFNNIPNQVWLTPFLDFLLKNDVDNLEDSIVLKELERIDNTLLPGDKKEMSWNLLNGTVENPSFDSIKEIFNEPSGTHFNHYWFYKLEYLLWKNWNDKTNEKFKRYRITSKNSVEHVFPQNEEYKTKLDGLNDGTDWLNCFGNLALLSVGQNSSYSNQDVDKKRIDFNRKDVFDSLKLAKIYANPNWNTNEIKEHQEEMISIIEAHYNSSN
jgi:uncharacterized protein with ParB-like and HNH nuclease domain